MQFQSQHGCPRIMCEFVLFAEHLHKRVHMYVILFGLQKLRVQLTLDVQIVVVEEVLIGVKKL